MKDNKNNKNNTAYRLYTGAAAAAMPLAFAGVAQAQETQAVMTQPGASLEARFNDMLPANGAIESPLLLAPLVILPLLWWLMRLTPPPAARVLFPQVKLLKGMEQKAPVPDSAPLWLRLTQLAAVSAFFVGLAGPHINPDAPVAGDGAMVVVVDNDWSVAHPQKHAQREREAARLFEMAEDEGRRIVLVPTAPPADGTALQVVDTTSAATARAAFAGMGPVPWPTDRTAALQALNSQVTLPADETASVVWLSNGLDSDDATAFAQGLAALGALTVQEDPAAAAPVVLVPPGDDVAGLSMRLLRPENGTDAPVTVTALDIHMRPVAQAQGVFTSGATETTVTFNLPDELRADITRLDVEGQDHAAAAALIDDAWRTRPVGRVIARGDAVSQAFDFFGAAVKPGSTITTDTLDNLLKKNMAVIILDDILVDEGRTAQALDEWVRDGGTLIRAAGPRLSRGTDNFLPVALSTDGMRAVGGAMTWEQPLAIMPFAPQSPFYGLDIPANITVSKQVLAQPGPGVDERTLARLSDGTPFVTAEKRGEGEIVMFHTGTALDWSNLSISGLFPAMVQAMVDGSAGVRGLPPGDAPLPPVSVMDAQGRLQDAGSAVRGLTADAVKNGFAGPQTPPGLYGNDTMRRAHNLGALVAAPALLPAMPEGTVRTAYADSRRQDLSSWFLMAAAGLFTGAMAGRAWLARSRKSNDPQPR